MILQNLIKQAKSHYEALYNAVTPAVIDLILGKPTSGSRIIPDPTPEQVRSGIYSNHKPGGFFSPENEFIRAIPGEATPAPKKGQLWRTKDKRRNNAAVIVAVGLTDVYTDNEQSIRIDRLLKRYTYEGFYPNYD